MTPKRQTILKWSIGAAIVAGLVGGGVIFGPAFVRRAREALRRDVREEVRDAVDDSVRRSIAETMAQDEQAATDAALEALSVEGETMVPSFSPRPDRYAVHVPYATDAVALTATANQLDAAITVRGRPLDNGAATGPITIEPGLNEIELTVTAPDGETSRTTVVKVIRAQPTVDWRQVLEHAPWPGRDSAGELVYDGAMWLIGGYIPKVIGDVWRSTDGRTWRQVGEVPSEAGVNIPVNFVHEGRMWVTSNKGELFASSDGSDWELVNSAPPWAGRYAAGSTTFDGRMWVMGGMTGKTLHNDVWSSTDGKQWTQVTADAGWSPRQLFGNVVTHDGKMWAIGGGVTRYEPFKGYRDVWCSDDGENWRQVTGEAPWTGRIWSTCILYHNRIFLLGGFSAQPVWKNRGYVWYSADGENWKRLQTETNWTPRHELSAYVHDERLWVVAGNTWPLLNDVWSLQIPGLVFLTQPVIEDYVGAGYHYLAEADFNAAAAPVKYRLLDAPHWLSVDKSTGFITGLTPAAGDYPVTLEAFDDAGETARQHWTIHVRP